jgi:GT2 family glycosyltransferase
MGVRADTAPRGAFGQASSLEIPIELSVVLPNYNGANLLRRNLPSIIAAAKGIATEIIVVDDASTDDSVAYLRSHYPDVIVLRNVRNLGFSETCNRGIRSATGKFVCVSNTDVTFKEDFFRVGLKAFDSESIFAVKGDIFNQNSLGETVNIDTTTRLYQKRGLLRFDTVITSANRDSKYGLDKSFVSLGCCFISRTEILKKLKGFDPVYSPFYWEDTDLTFRALQQGYRVVYQPEAVVYHQLSSTINKYRKKRYRKLVSDRNKFLFAWRFMAGRTQWTQHFVHVGFGIMTRWLILDWSFYGGLFWALWRRFFWRNLNGPSWKRL